MNDEDAARESTTLLQSGLHVFSSIDQLAVDDGIIRLHLVRGPMTVPTRPSSSWCV
jgi:hypothetical protein